MNLPDDRKRRQRSRDPQIIREELLRPSHYLGYDRDEMGRYFMGREAFELAESQFRRAVYLNPFEPVFKIHWAAALIKLNRRAEARDLLVGVFRKRQDDVVARQMWHCFWPGEPFPEPEPGPSGTMESDPFRPVPTPDTECRDPPP